MENLISRKYAIIHNSLLIISSLAMMYFMSFYYKNFYMFSVYILSSLFYCAKIILIKYNPNKISIIRYIDYLVFGIFILQIVLIRLFVSIENIYIHADKTLFPCLYNNVILNSAWLFGFMLFVLFHFLNKKLNKPILFIVGFIFLIIAYFYFVLNILFA